MTKTTTGCAGAFLLGAMSGVVVSAATRAALTSPQAGFARTSGSSIAAPDSVGLVTDFLNAAYYRRPAGDREVDDLRLAFSILTTRWHRRGYRRLRAPDVVAFHRAFGPDRLRDDAHSPRGTLDRARLLDGAARLHGDWFPDAYTDDERRGWGVTFETVEDRHRYQPERRQEHAALGPLTPPQAPGREQVWHTYPAVEMPSAERVAAAVNRPETWPDYASELGRFTPVRSGGLADQTFEIEVAGATTSPTPVWLRGYVTITRLVTADDLHAIGAYVAELNESLARLGRDEPPAVPDGATPLAAFDLTTHEGHFMGSARNRLVLYLQDGTPYLRAAGTWDPMRWDLAQVYQRAGQHSQHAFWGMATPQESMLHQIALAAA